MFSLVLLLLITSICWPYFTNAGKSAAIHYGTGAISGFFSRDHVTLGELVVEDQVIVVN